VSRAVALHAVLAWVVAACGDNWSNYPQCIDGIDNDEDTLIDVSDPGCHTGLGTEASDMSTICGDGLDNDGDDLIDFPADPGCASASDIDEGNEPVAQCRDGRDNDGDALADFPDDPGCLSAIHDDEGDDCPSGEDCPACGNGTDDDGDTRIDFPSDDGCYAASDINELAANPLACGPNLTVGPLPPGGTSAAIAGGQSDLYSTACGGIGDEVAYELFVAEPTVIVASTVSAATTVDTVLYLRTDCTDLATEVACNDNASFTSTQSTLIASIQPGVYYLVVDTDVASTSGTAALSVLFYNGEGEPCTSDAECGPGLVCRIPLGETMRQCAKPVCDDGLDDDGDGTPDFPGDPGCADPADADEVDDCPSGPTCPACANGVDDDGDTFIDYPDDVDCNAASQVVEGCAAEADPMVLATTGSVTGSTVGASNDFDLSCDFSANIGPDRVVLVSLPEMQALHFDLAGTSFDAVLGVRDQSCSAELACNQSFVLGGEVIDLAGVAAGTYAVVIDGYNGANGAFALNIGGTIAPGGRCDGALAVSGAIACPTNYACTGGVCLGTLECNNGVDDDGDTFVGYPDDPGCAGFSDDDESDTCPAGPGCPECGDGVDNDGDTFVDYPDDPSCVAASTLEEAVPPCPPEDDPAFVLSQPATTGNLVGATDDWDLTCDGTGGLDLVYFATVPQLQTLRIDTVGSPTDTVIAMYPGTCTGTSLGCNDDGGGSGTSLLNFTNVAANTYAIVVANYSTSFPPGPFTLNISGTIVPGGACNGALAASGALVCPTNYTCNGSTCVGSLQCNNGVDDDGDTFVGYPDDPGCTAIDDATEADDCPSGPTCPDCSNDLDDDGDGATDYPADPSCVAASTTSELVCDAIESSPITAIAIPAYAGTTVGAGNEFTPTCASSTAPDVAFSFDLPQPVTTLVIDTTGSAFDTTVTLTTAACTNLGCDDDSGGGGTSRLVWPGLAAGSYGIVVDGWSTSSGNYVLNIRGTVPSGAACTHALFSTGVLVCPANHACMAGTCQPI
jgi:hypothetical protein